MAPSIPNTDWFSPRYTRSGSPNTSMMPEKIRAFKNKNPSLSVALTDVVTLSKTYFLLTKNAKITEVTQAIALLTAKLKKKSNMVYTIQLTRVVATPKTK